VQAWPPLEEGASTAVEEALNMEAKRSIKYLYEPGLLLRRPRAQLLRRL
jgi:hypothetical protein